mmetsp:Transcript_38452/g.69304  ORF Transcript_38452/g.69304 Transcript_38452/m.69304 type:complete len:258 (-) Transcript_38452:480-1253(-)
MIKRHYTILRPMNKQHRTPNARHKVHIRKPIPGQSASALEDYSIDAEEGCVENEAADGVAFFGGAGGEVAGGARAEGSAVENDGGGWDLEDGGEVGVGGGDVGEAVVFGGVSLIRRQPITRIIIGKYIHPQHLTQKFTPRINIPQIFRIGMTVQNSRCAMPQSPPRPCRHGHTHLQFFRSPYLRRGGHDRGVVTIVSPRGTSFSSAVSVVVAVGTSASPVRFTGERGAHPLSSVVLGAFDEEGGDAFSEGVGEPYYL